MGGNMPRVGVFVCHCGVNIGGVIDVPEVVNYAKTLPDVVYADRNLYTCASDGIDSIKEAIKKHNLDRVVVASCTPRTHEPLFRATCEEAGLNKYLFEMASIRELCSWVHAGDPERATEKAKDIVRMAVAKARLLEPQEELEIDVEPSSLIIGGGVAGITAATCLANQGFRVYLIEKELELGGMLRKLHKIFPTQQDASELLKEAIGNLKAHKNITTLTSTVVKDVEGYIGNYRVTVQRKDGKNGELKVGTIIVATGAENFEPMEMYGYRKYENVITQLELEQLFRSGELGRPDRIVMIQCVGAREKEGMAYCSRICCMTAIKNALNIKELYQDTDVYILYRDLQTYGKEYGEYQWKAKEKNIKFIKYVPERPPEVIPQTNGKLTVKIYNVSINEEIKIKDCDLTVLSTPLIQHQAGKELSPILKVPLGSDLFFFEAHYKLRPIDFATDGIYVCGTAHGSKTISESITQACAAASRAAIPMAKKHVRSEAITAQVNEEACIGCGLCEYVCPYGAAELVRKPEGKWVSKINEIMCKGCGDCAVICPAVAIEMRHFKEEQILAQIGTSFLFPAEGEFEPKILVFACNWCSYAGADLAGVSRIQYPPNVRLIRVMCSGRVDPLFVFKAFRSGIDGVLITGCHPGECHYVSGNLWAEARYEVVKSWMEKIGMKPERLRLAWISASEGAKFASVIKDMVADMKKLGPSSLTRSLTEGGIR